MPTRDELYLAYRHAKATIFFERRGVGLLDLARFERDLPSRLDALATTLSENDGWFDGLPSGHLWITPKRLRSPDPDLFCSDATNVTRIGPVRTSADLDVQVRYIPSPECAIVEVLFLWRFGPVLQSLLSLNAIGYRLDLRHDRLIPTRRWLFEYWPRRYEEFRRAPIDAALRELTKNGAVLVLSADLADFYDTIDPAFLLSRDFVGELQSSHHEIDLTEYHRAASSLLRLYTHFRRLAVHRTGLQWETGIPIGCLTSRLVANLALATLDRSIEDREQTRCYRRYVDDFVIVASTDDSDPGDLDHVISTYIPHIEVTTGVFQFKSNELLRHGSKLTIQKAKCRAHHLIGTPGRDFLLAIRNDFGRLVSEGRAFLDPSVLAESTFQNIVRAGALGRPLTVLRDVDRPQLEHFALSTRLRTLERVSVLVDNEQAGNLVQSALTEVLRFLEGDGNWVEHLEAALRMLRLAIRAGDWKDARRLIAYMDALWGDTRRLRDSAQRLYHRGREIRNSLAWVALRNYLHTRRIEAICSVLRPPKHGLTELQKWLGSDGVIERTRVVRWQAFVRRARLLAATDLRAFDREDDAFGPNRYDTHPGNTEFGHDDAALNQRLNDVRQFVDICNTRRDLPWAIGAYSLFLCTRPPSYFDVARRWLYRSESTGFRSDIFEQLLRVVNAIRGTRYADPVGGVIDERTVRIPYGPPDSQRSVGDPRLILGNLVSTPDGFRGSASPVNGSTVGRPVLTVARLRGVAHIIDATSRLARREPARRNLLVLPELSLPRAWLRPIANYVARWELFSLIAGLEYLHHPTRPWVVNQVWITMPGSWQTAAAWPWTKVHPARIEAEQLREHDVRFPPAPGGMSLRRAVVDSPYGLVSVLICSELIEAARISDLVGRVELVAVPSWNQDTASYDHLIQSAGVQLNAIIAVANNGEFSDCRAWAPMTDRWRRDLCRLIERDEDDIVFADIPLASLRAFRRTALSGLRRATAVGRTEERPEWRPLPPYWPS